MRTRRGLSSVVGMVFAIIAIATSVGYVTYSMNILDQYNQSIISRNQQTVDTGREQFQLYNVKISNSKFNITIANTGNLPVNITKFWVQNTSATDWVNFYAINKAVNPGGLLINIGQSSAVYANTANAYNLKIITSRGNSMQFSLGSPGVKPLYMQLQMIPSSIHTKSYVTAFFVVTNNMTSNNLLTNIQPVTNLVCSGAATSTKVSGPTPSQYPSLQSGGTAIFKWVYNMTGSYGSTATCTASLQNGLATNTASDTATIANN